MVAVAINAVSDNLSQKTWETAQPLRAPPLALTLIEGRGLAELTATYAFKAVLNLAPKGDGHPVVVLPGFLASDLSTRPLRRFLTSLGYDARGWGQGRNLGRFNKMCTVLESYVDTIYSQTGQKVSLIGWSLGGAFARHLALVMPDKIRSVITLSSPFAAEIDATNTKKLYELFSQEGSARRANLTRLSGDLPVPNTALFSRFDGVVNWQAALSKPAANAENIEIRLASHIGIVLNPASFWAISDRLAQADGVFEPFSKIGPFFLAYG